MNQDQIESLVRELEEKAAYAYGDSSAYINTYIACGIIRSFLLTHDQEVRERTIEECQTLISNVATATLECMDKSNPTGFNLAVKTNADYNFCADLLNQLKTKPNNTTKDGI